MQAKSVELGEDYRIAWYLGIVFLLQSLAALCIALSEQIYDNAFSCFATSATAVMFLAVTVSIPAVVTVAVLELNQRVPQVVIFIPSLAGINMSNTFDRSEAGSDTGTTSCREVDKRVCACGFGGVVYCDG